MELLTHVTAGIASRHYVGFATRDEANQFYAITPDSVPEPLAIKKKFYVPYSRDELIELLKVKPLSTIAREIGCSDCGLRKHCIRLGIETPKRGEWTRRLYAAVYGKAK